MVPGRVVIDKPLSLTRGPTTLHGDDQGTAMRFLLSRPWKRVAIDQIAAPVKSSGGAMQYQKDAEECRRKKLLRASRRWGQPNTRLTSSDAVGMRSGLPAHFDGGENRRAASYLCNIQYQVAGGKEKCMELRNAPVGREPT
jgi:hypothetical protein